MVKHTARDLLKILRKNNFVEYKIRGDHHKFHNIATNRIVVLNYKSLKDTISEGLYHDCIKAINGESKWQFKK